MKRIAVILFLVMMYLPSIILCGQQSDLVLAEKLMNEGLYELAYDEFIEFAERNDDSPDVGKAYYLAYDCLFLQGRYDDAISKFKQFIRTFPLSPFAAFAHERMGEIYVKSKDYEKAKGAFETFLKIYPENEKAEDALFWLGEAHYNMKEYEKARYYYKLCIKQFPKGTFYDYALFSLGYSYRDEKKYDIAEQFYNALIDSLPKSSLVQEAHMAIGEMHFEKKTYNSALSVFSQYRERYPKGTLFDKSLLYTGRTHLKKGENEAAITAFQTLIEKFQNSQYKNPALYYVAWIHFEQNNYNNALQHFTLVDKTSKLYYPSFYWSGIIYERQGRKDAALKQFKQLSVMKGAGAYRNDALYERARIAYEEKESQKADSLVSVLGGTDRKWKALLLKGNNFFEKEQFAEAMEIYTGIVRSEANGVRKDAIYRLASSLYKTGDFEKAEEYFNVYLTNYPDGEDRKEALLLFAECAYKLKKWKDALERYRSVKEQFPETKEEKLALMGEGWTLSKLGRDREAYAILKKVKAVGAEKKDWITLGDAAYNAGKLSEAILNYKKASEEKHVKEIALLKLGNTYFRIRQYKNAISTYDKLIHDFPMGNLADDAYYKKSEALRKLGDYSNSNATLASLRKLYPASEFLKMSYLLSGDNYFNIGDFENARLQYQKVIDILGLPGDTSAVIPIHGIMKCIIRQDDMKRAAEFADAYVNRFKGTYLSDRITMLKADMFYYSGDVEKAEKEYDKVEHKKLKPTALYYQAQCLQSLKKLAETEKKLREILDKYPNSKMVSKTALLLGKVLYEERKYSESLIFFEKRKTLKTDEDFEVAYLKGHVYLKLNYKEKAMKTLQGLSDVAEGKWKGKALLLLGDIMVADNDYSKALPYYDKAVKTGESTIIAEAYYKKGKALSKQGKNKEALKTFLKIKYNLPASPFSTRAIYEAAEIALKLGKQQDALSLYKEVIERNDDKKLTIRAKDRLKTLNP